MPVRDPDHRVLCSSWILNDHLCCCIHVPVPEKSHPYTNKKCVFSLLFTFFSQFKALIIFARERKDNNLAVFSQCWVLTKSKYSPTFCRQCLLSWEENGKLFFTAFWKKKIEKNMNFHILCLESTSLSSYILTDAEITVLHSNTEVTFIC